MKKKFVMAVAAVAMAAVVGVSAFAATGVTVPSITGGSDTASTIVAPSSDDASETTKMVYKTIVSTEATPRRSWPLSSARRLSHRLLLLPASRPSRI